jgi:hypothetical protein
MAGLQEAQEDEKGDGVCQHDVTTHTLRGSESSKHLDTEWEEVAMVPLKLEKWFFLSNQVTSFLI